MKKIMFNDRFGLTEAVLNGQKTMTRRVMPDGLVQMYMDGLQGCATQEARYKIGEEVAVVQSYKEIWKQSPDPINLIFADKHINEAGWNNKMFVKAELMPYHIRITDIKVERLQDISDDDCGREGIVPVTWRQYLKQDWNDLTPQKYVDHDVWTLPKFVAGIKDAWGESDPDEYIAESPQVAFAVLIMKLMGRKVWDNNPYVFAYGFELVKGGAK